MKSIRYILPAILALAICSCDIQIDDTFGDDAQSRLAKTNALNLKNLQSAQNGWVMDYYPHPTRSYGGYNILVRFDEQGYCYMLNEKATGFTDADICKSEYKVASDQGSVLSFCTLNPYIHDFADPGITEADGIRYGYRGDFEFAIMSSSEEEIVLQGIKTGNIVKMYPLAQDVAWGDYLSQCVRVSENMNEHLFSGYAVTADGQEVGEVSVKSYPVLILPDPVAGNPEQKKQVAFKYTTNGIKLYEPATVGNVAIQELELSPDGKELLCNNGGQQIVLSGTYVEGFIPYKDYLGSWHLYSTHYNVTDFDITIESKEHGKTFVIKGFPYGITMPVVYNRETGTLSLPNLTDTECYIAIDNVNYRLRVQVARDGAINSTDWYGLVGINSEDNGKKRVDWVCDGGWTMMSGDGARGFAFCYYRNSAYTTRSELRFQDVIMIQND